MYMLTVPILQILSQEHRAVLSILERLDRFLDDNPAKRPAPDYQSSQTRAIFEDLSDTMEGEIKHHYTFEEENLFPRFSQAADPGISTMLQDEHETIRPIATRLAELSRDGLYGNLSEEAWKEFHSLAGEMIERETFHIQKEEMGFLPGLENMISEDESSQLERIYAGMKGTPASL